jgi:TnpA family transposase
VGGIAYHYVSDTNVALFSRFIPCGVWEAVHLIEGLLANKSDIQPSTVHADTHGQSAPVFALATLFGFDLMPRIRNFKDLIFFRPSEHLVYPHIDALFGEVGRSVRTAALLRYLADPQLRTRITAATNKVESYNGFSHWLAFGNNGSAPTPPTTSPSAPRRSTRSSRKSTSPPQR